MRNRVDNECQRNKGTHVRLRLILLSSACLNALLLAWSVGVQRRAQIVLPPSATSNSETSNQPALTWMSPGSLSSRPGGPRWTEIQSDNLARYIANLRAAGFPEPTVQNVIVTELERLYASRLPRYSHPGFWQSGPDADAAQAEHRRIEWQLETEKRSRIKELLGVEWHETSAASREDGPWLLSLNDRMSVDKLERLSRLWAKIRGQSSDLRQNAQLQTAESENLRRQAYAEAVAELRNLLGPADFEEMELCKMASEVMDVWGPERLFGCVMTGQELREFLRIRKEAALPLGDVFDISPPLVDEDTSRSMDDGIRALLGEERFKGFQRAQDPQFRWIRGALRDDTSMESTWAVYDIHAGVKTAANAAFDEPGTPPEDLQAYLRELRAWAEDQVRQTLGPEKFAGYAKNSGNLKWLDELTVRRVNSQ